MRRESNRSDEPSVPCRSTLLSLARRATSDTVWCVPEWAAEVDIQPEMARRLIAEQFPELEVRSLRLLAEGWDNSVWVVDEQWAFRFPRRAIAVAGVEREIQLLPRLAPVLPLPIPAPVFVGRPADGYPWPFFGAMLLPGREAPDANLSDASRIRAAPVLGEFLRSLHDSRLASITDAVRTLPVDPMKRGDMAHRVPRTIERLSEVERLGLWRSPAAICELLEAAHSLPPPDALVVVHGDLHFRHLVVDENSDLVGIIDWGDLCRADASIDLPLIWSFLPAEGRAAFLAAYGPVSSEQLLRARVLALFLCAALAIYAHHEGIESVRREAIYGLERASVG
jgi:aminoglycoside phosphotransferase (APT) family kinase protein